MHRTGGLSSHSLRRRDPQRRVRFSLPEDASPRQQPQSILRDRRATPDPSLLQRRVSAPLAQSQGGMGMTRNAREKSHALENLRGLRDYVKEACNFHGDDKRMALSVPSVDDLVDLINYVAELRPDAAADAVTRRDSKRLRLVLDPSRRFPHEQLIPEKVYDSDHEQNFWRAARGRDRRRAEHALYRFVSRQLQINYEEVRAMRKANRQSLIRQAFRSRIAKFARPHASRTAAATAAAGALYSMVGGRGAYGQDGSPDKVSQGTGSAPQSPAGRPSTKVHSSLTDPPPGLRRAYDAETGMPFDYEPLPALSLPNAWYDHAPTAASSQSKLKRKNTPAPPSLRGNGSYLGDNDAFAGSPEYPLDSVPSTVIDNSHRSPRLQTRTPPQPVAHTPYPELSTAYGSSTNPPYPTNGYPPAYSGYQRPPANHSAYQGTTNTTNTAPTPYPATAAMPAGAYAYQGEAYGLSPQQRPAQPGYGASAAFQKTPPQRSSFPPAAAQSYGKTTTTSQGHAAYPPHHPPPPMAADRPPYGNPASQQPAYSQHPSTYVYGHHVAGAHGNGRDNNNASSKYNSQKHRY